MRIAIMGTGNMSEGLATGWVKTGHQVVVGSRDPSGKQDVAGETGARIATHAEALAGADAVVLSLPYAQVEAFAAANAASLRGRTVIDITNPFGSLPDNRISGAEVTARAIGDGARVVAAFKTNSALVLGAPFDEGGMQRDVFYCGDDLEAKRVTRKLIEDLGFRAMDLGPLKNSRVLDPMVPIMLELERRLGIKGSAHRPHWKFVTP